MSRAAAGERGMPVAEACGQTSCAAPFPCFQAQQDRRINGPAIPAATPHTRIVVLRQAADVASPHHAVELPGGDGHAPGRPAWPPGARSS
jgi:hypothetical protein